MARSRGSRSAHWTCALVVALASTCSTSSPSYAASPESPGSSKPAPPASAQQLADEAYDQHAEGHYADAIALYLKAYDLSNAGTTLFNIATIYDRKLHEKKLAVDYYRRYLAAIDAQPDLVRKANERLVALKREEDAEDEARRQAATQPRPEPPSEAPAPAAIEAPMTHVNASRHRWRSAGVAVSIAGAVGIGTSLALGFAAKNKNDDANMVCQGSACATPQGVTLAEQAGAFARISTIAFASGLSLVGVGLVLFFVSTGPMSSVSSSSARLTVSPAIGPEGGSLSLRGGF